MFIRAALRAIKVGGLPALAGFVQDYRQAEVDRAALKLDPHATSGRRSSISDAGLYPLFCQMAAADLDVFARFRRSLIYRDILEHVTRKQGEHYLAEIEHAGVLQSELQGVLRSDTVGDPYRYAYGSYGLASPSTLRYLKVASDLALLFGSLENMTVAEIGIGYGGQCRVATSVWPIRRYRLFDIPEVLALAQRFLGVSGVDLRTIDACDGRSPDSASSDLVISNYAFSELNREVQEMYWENVVANSSRGYFTYNHITPDEYDSLTALEFAARIPGALVLPESPLTHPGNVIVAWGMNI